MTETQQQPSAPPANAAEARTVLEGKMADKDWGALLLRGDAAVNREYLELRAKADNPDPSDVVAAAMSGKIGDVPDSSVALMANTASMLREIGIREEVIKEALEGRELTQQEHDLVTAWRTRQMRDPVFVKDFLSGDPEARQKMTLSAIALSGGVKEGGRF
jgi:hypothetical protein